VGRGPKITCSHRKAESSIILHCITVHAVLAAASGATSRPYKILKNLRGPSEDSSDRPTKNRRRDPVIYQANRPRE
jgi:hypothetical protein